MFGMKRSQARIGADAVELALDLTPEAITLHERASSGGWKKFASTALDDPEFQVVLGLLRAEAEARTGGPRPVRLWLPADQVLQRRVRIESQDQAGRLREAFEFIEKRTVFRPDDVAVAVAPSDRGGEASILITFAETWREARDYSERWGFQPGAVSTRHRAGDFGAEGPIFRLREAMDKPPAPDRKRGLIAAGAGLAAVTAAAILWTLWPDGRPPGPASPVPPAEMAAGAASGIAPVSRETARIAPSEAVSPRQPEPQDATAGPEPAVTLSMRQAPGEEALGQAGQRFPDETPAEPGANPAPVRMAPWAGPLETPHPVAEAPAPVPAHEPDPSGSEQPSFQVMVPAPPVAPAAVPQPGVGAAGTPPDPVALFQPDAMPPVRAFPAAPSAPPVSGPEPASVPEPPPDPTAALPARLPHPRPPPGAAGAPETAPVPPPPRPTAMTQPEAVSPPAAGQPDPAPDPEPPQAVTATAAPPRITPSPGEPGPPAQENAAGGDAAAALSVMTSPTPLARPARPAIQTELPAASLLPALGGSAPATVRAAATDRGLPLDKTALIGILNLDSGRKALLRMPDGRYRSVVVGDVLDGWRVSAIGVDAMRVTRSGQDLTLLLVSR
jgi:hypothetical protein